MAVTKLPDRDNEFRRARLMPKGGRENIEKIFGPALESNILYPLHATRGIIFPYTPVINWGAEVSYQDFHFTHSNYKYFSFEKSAPSTFQMQSMFTAQTSNEALYLLAVMHFLKSATKLNFGEQAGTNAAVPPPVLSFRYLGKYMFNDVPVLIKNYTYELPNDVDYVPARFGTRHDEDTFIPVQINISLDFEIQMNTADVQKNFNLEEFHNGGYVNSGKHWI